MRAVGFKKYLQVLLLATIGCVSPETVPHTVPLQPTKQIDIPSLAAKKNRKLIAIGLEATIDNIERGGIGHLKDGKLAITEIENEVRLDEERYWKYINGDPSYLDILSSHANIAGIVQATCVPESAGYYTSVAARLTQELPCLPSLPLKLRRIRALTFWAEYDAHTRHNMYILQPKSEIPEEETLFRFHTHQSGQPPSRQDLDVSMYRDEVVVSITKEGTHTLYYVSKGMTTILDSSECGTISRR